MEPTMQNKDYVWTEKVSYLFNEPDYNDIVILNFSSVNDDEKYIIKRIIGLEGDKIEFIKDKKTNTLILKRNGKILNEEYIKEPMTYGTNMTFEVGKDEVFVLGDNRNNSRDSRYYGPFKEENIYGHVFLELKDNFQLH